MVQGSPLPTPSAAPARRGIYEIVGIPVFVFLTALALWSAFIYSKSLAKGEILAHPVPEMVWDWMPAPANAAPEVANQLGADYMALLFPARHFHNGGGMYDAGLDPWGRPSYTYPPFTLWLYGATLARLDFIPSLLIHNWLQVAFVLLAFFVVAKKLALKARRMGWGALFLFWCLFLSCPGVLTFERGQTELFVLASFLFVIGGIFSHDWRLFLLAGLFGAFKWSSYPFLFMASGFYGLLHARQSTRRTLLNFAALWAVPVLTSAPFVHPSIAFYVKMVRESELTFPPNGVSQLFFLNRWFAKTTPFITLLLGGLLVMREKKRSHADLSFITVIFLTLALFVAETYGTTCYEYRDVPLFAFVLLGVWLSQHRPDKPGRFAYSLGLVFLAIYISRPVDAWHTMWEYQRPLFFILFPLALALGTWIVHLVRPAGPSVLAADHGEESANLAEASPRHTR